MVWENIKIALTSMVHNKMRTLLSLLGIIIGVAAVVAILNLGQSVSESITESMNVGGIDMVNIFPSGSSRELNVFDEAFGETLMNNVDGIEAVLPVASSTTRVRSGQDILSVSISGVTSNFFEVNNAELLYGEYFTALDNIKRTSQTSSSRSATRSAHTCPSSASPPSATWSSVSLTRRIPLSATASTTRSSYR